MKFQVLGQLIFEHVSYPNNSDRI